MKIVNILLFISAISLIGASLYAFVTVGIVGSSFFLLMSCVVSGIGAIGNIQIDEG